MSVGANRGPTVDVPLDGTDEFFGVLVGLYAAVLVTPAVVAGVALRVTTDASTLYFTLLGTTVAVVAGVGYLARSERLAVRLGATSWVWTAAVVPFGYAGALIATVGTGGPAAVAGVSMLAMITGMFVGMGLAVAARNRHAKAVLATAEEYVRFDARGPERDRRLAKWSVAVLVGGGAVGLLASFVVTEFQSFRWLFHVVVAGGAGLLGTQADRTVAVTDAGLLVGTPVSKHLCSWSDFESYAVTDDAIVIRRVGWWPWGLRDVRRDPEDVDDVAAVKAALAEFLPRR